MKPDEKQLIQRTPIAIIGMGCFFPKSSGLKEYWRLLFRGEDGIRDIPKTHWSYKDYFDEDPKKPDHVYCKRGGFLSPVLFDPTEFGIPPSTLEATDTSQLLGLVTAKMALEDAGYGDTKNNDWTFNKDKTSVILGVTGTQELVIPLSSRLGHPKWRKALEDAGVDHKKAEEAIKRMSDSYVPWQENSFPGLLGNVVAGRISNRLNFGGTNCVVDAACASSMGAIHLAILELVSGRSDMVITGGVDTLNDIFMHMCFAKTLVLSSTGDARPFSKDADGTVLGEGVGMLVLKRLEDAEKENNRIYAVIKALGSSSDGKSQSIYAPRPEGQAKALGMAYKNADIEPNTVELIETHGTGTKVGDTVEFQALKQVFGKTDKNEKKYAIGSVKSMIGHTKAAAGAAGIIKSALSVYHKVLPPTLKVNEPDPNLGINETSFYLNTETRPWFSNKEHPRRSGVSAFGFGGSNFHVILEEYEKNKDEVSWNGSNEIFALSASTKKELRKLLMGLKSSVDDGLSNKEIAVKAAKSRDAFSFNDTYRLLIVSETSLDSSEPCWVHTSVLLGNAINALITNRQKSRWNLRNIYFGGPEKTGKIAFVFPGQGSQYIGMGRDLVCIFPEAFKILENANEKYEERNRLSDFIYPFPVFTKEEKKIQEEMLMRTDIAQPAIGTISVSMLMILQRFGIKPNAVCGHSYGELSALCAAGWIDIDTLLYLSISRGKLMAEASQNNHNTGAMLAVKVPLVEIADLIKDIPDVILANKNTPDQGVLSGTIDAIGRAERRCKERGLITKKLPVSAAFHSELVRDAKEPFMESLKKVDITPTDVPVLSNTTGMPYPSDPDHARKILGEHLLYPVDFKKEIENLFEMGVRTFVEVGPKSVLTGLVKSILNNSHINAISLDASLGKRSGLADLARSLCHIASLGHTIELNKWEHPSSETKKQLMSIPILGTNYRNGVTEDGGRTTDDGRQRTEGGGLRADDRGQRAEGRGQMTEGGRKKSSSIEKLMDDKKGMMDKDKQKESEFITSALRVVQEGLKSMQTLQMQTAETHKKFLETQTEAGRTLQKMMEKTQRLAEVALGIKTGIEGKKRSIEETRESSQEIIDSDVLILPADTPAENSMEESLVPQSEKDREILKPSNDAYNQLEGNMLEVVSLLTGYPMEMLGMDMDIEADLGIDSIKRVEILSTLEEKIPNLPPISPEIMGSLKTLGQIAEYLSGSKKSDEPIKPVEQSSKREVFGSQNENIESSNMDLNELEAIMLEVVSLLTGYPMEMLGMDMDIEADLGIDSIKRVEILSTLEEKIPNLPSISPEIMGSLKTLGQIAEYLSGAGKSESSQMEDDSIFIDNSEYYDNEIKASSQYFDSDLSDAPWSKLERRIVSVIETPFNKGKKLSIPRNRKVFITDDKTGLSEAIATEFRSFNIDTKLISHDILKNGEDIKNAAGIVIIQNSDLKEVFQLTNHVAPDLLASAKEGGALFATISRLDGAFGFKGRGFDDPMQGGLAGLAKTASIEWEGVFCRAIDITPNWKENKDISKAVVAELLYPDHSSPVEIGIDPSLQPGMRYTLELESSPYQQNQKLKLDLSNKDVFIITGGARGVTASAAHTLAEHGKPTLVLMGRSPNPTPEPEWLLPINDEADIKKAILDNEFGGNNASPMQIEKRYKMHTANREISRNLDSLRSSGATVLYYSMDIRDSDSVNLMLEDVRSAHGTITGIIHGAGVLEDRLIIDKTAEQFERVFDTKVKGLNNLLELTKEDNLKYLVLFSSITARIGNKGQADYAAANEVLNKIAQQEALKRPDCKVISINWGPWDGGMVSSTLKREFIRNKIDLIPMDSGSMCMLYEMMRDKSSSVEVVISGKTFPDFHVLKQLSSKKENDQLSLAFKREIDVDRYPILKSHKLDGKSVVPFAIMTEWFGHGALHENPGLFLHGIDNMRLLNGIILDSEKRIIRLMTGKAKRNASIFEVDVELRDGVEEGIEIIHSSAKAILADNLSQPPLYKIPKFDDAKDYFRNIDEVYEKILFHGYELRGIREIVRYSSHGMIAKIFSAPSPEKWMKNPLRSKWIGDPLVLDSAFQMASLWCYDQKGIVSLPSYSANYRQYRSNFPTEGITAVLEVKEVGDHKMRGDFTFLDSENIVVAQLTGYEAVMNDSLLKAFKPQYASTA